MGSDAKKNTDGQNVIINHIHIINSPGAKVSTNQGSGTEKDSIMDKVWGWIKTAIGWVVGNPTG